MKGLTVYVLNENDYEGVFAYGIFATPEGALASLNKDNEGSPYYLGTEHEGCYQVKDRENAGLSTDWTIDAEIIGA